MTKRQAEARIRMLSGRNDQNAEALSIWMRSVETLVNHGHMPCGNYGYLNAISVAEGMGLNLPRKPKPKTSRYIAASIDDAK